MAKVPQPILWRTGRQLAEAVRAAREAKGLTQSDLAKRARVGLKFLYELETGKDTLRSDKVLDVLSVLGLQLNIEARQPRANYAVKPKSAPAQPDYIGMACTSASVSLRDAMTPDELIRALLTGEPAPERQAHLTVLLEEAPAELLRGLVAQVGAWAKTGAVAANLKSLAAKLGVRPKHACRP